MEQKVTENSQVESRASRFYQKSYKLFLIITMAMIIFSIAYLYYFDHKTGDFIKKDVTLTGGTSITVFDGNVSISALKAAMINQFPDLEIRGISDISTGKQTGVVFMTQADSNTTQTALEKYLGYKLTSANSSIEFTGATLSASFYAQLMSAIIASFLLMAWVVFMIFGESRKVKGIATAVTAFGVAIALRSVGWVVTSAVIAIAIGALIAAFSKNSSKKEKIAYLTGAAVLIAILYVYPVEYLTIPVLIALVVLYIMDSIPSFAVILSAFADIIMTVAAVDIAGMRISSAGIIAFLMLIGYSVDTDILLTSRLLRNKEGNVNHRLFGAFKTGITMTLTAIAAVGVSLLLTATLSDTLRQIFTIVLVGLLFDIFNTWLTNASMLKWYMEVKKIE